MGLDANYHAVLNAHGLYNSEQFVLRLSPLNHRLVTEAEVIGQSGKSFTPEMVRAYSTYLHETIHWWQHVGSTTGFVLSLCYPNQTHGNLTFLSQWSSKVDPQKSIRKWAMDGELAGRTHLDQAQADANCIINNAVDLELYKRWLMQPGMESQIYQDPYFKSQGHCFWMSHAILLNNLAPDLDPDFRNLPDPSNWDAVFEDMTSKQVIGYFDGSPMMRRKVGIRELFEGQACFSQMQFLCGALGVKSLGEFRQMGMLHGVYEKAFIEFLQRLGWSEPDDLFDPTIGLFLLICDIAINPVEGFPCDIQNFEQFVHHNDPGLRFELLCKEVADHGEKYIGRFKTYDKYEYDLVSSELCQDAGLLLPRTAWEQVASWTDENDAFGVLLHERQTLNFQPSNMVQRVILSHFISIAGDRLAHPEFFCWPGYWKSTGGGESWVQSMWLKNLSLFADQEDNNGIFIREFPGVEKEHLTQTLNTFFGSNMFYDLTRQWIIEDGPFSYGFDWLSEEYGDTDFKAAADRMFRSKYGFSTSDITFQV